MFLVVTLSILIILLCGVIYYRFYYCAKRCSNLKLPSTILYYVIKNSPTKLQIKISKSSKRMLNFIQKVRNYAVENVTVVNDDLINFRIVNNTIYLFIGINKILNLTKPITVSDEIVYSRMYLEEIYSVMDNVKFSHQYVSYNYSLNRAEKIVEKKEKITPITSLQGNPQDVRWRIGNLWAEC